MTAPSAASAAASAALAARPPPPKRVLNSLWLKVSEAKEFSDGAELDTFVSVNVNHTEKLRSKTIFVNATPMWDEDVQVEVNEEPQVDVILWESATRFSADRPIGKVILTAKEILAGAPEPQEKWLPLAVADTEGTVSGTIEIALLLTPPENNQCKLTVNLLSGTNLVSRDVNGLSDPYIVFSVLPDPDGASCQSSKIKKKTLNPKWHPETFEFPIPAPGNALVPGTTLHLTCWDWDRFTDDDFMGHCSLDLTRVQTGVKVGRSIPLQPKPVAVRETDSSGVAGGKKDHLSKARMFVHDIQTVTADMINTRVPGTVRIKWKYTEEVVLDGHRYDRLIKVIADKQFLLPVVLGKTSNEREAAAWALVKTYKYFGDAVTCLNAVIDHEIRTTLDVNTIFRGNSMASKGIDVFMKLIAMRYLHNTLDGPIKEVVNGKKSCEVDPTRLEKGEDIKKNWKHLKAAVTLFVDAIFSSSSKMPADLVAIFAHLRQSVKTRFSDNAVAQYTAISGFIFLRLFVAATLSPTLFDLWPEALDKRSARTFTLVAKTIQNLANLVEFGQKEAYMKEMNTVINERMPEMRKFLDEISTVGKAPGAPPVEKKRSSSGFFTFGRRSMDEDAPQSNFQEQLKIDVAKESSKLFHHFDRLRDRIIAEKDNEHIPDDLLQEMTSTLDELRPLHVIPTK